MIGWDKYRDIYILSLEIRNVLFRFPIEGQESRNLTIKIPYKERIKILSDSLLDGKLESRNEIQYSKRRNVRNRERIITINTWENGIFGSSLQILLYMFATPTEPNVFFLVLKNF